MWLDVCIAYFILEKICFRTVFVVTSTYCRLQESSGYDPAVKVIFIQITKFPQLQNYLYLPYCPKHGH